MKKELIKSLPCKSVLNVSRIDLDKGSDPFLIVEPIILIKIGDNEIPIQCTISKEMGNLVKTVLNIN